MKYPEKYNQLNLVEQQLLGFCHAKQGYNLESLIDSMGLTNDEWQDMKNREMVDHIDETVIDEIDGYFESKEWLKENYPQILNQ
ncbi:hypothetical protein [Flagellimonas nanhaiensis]|uniref:Uncharacterized protein n=1 Tax=Flagellimonas nanhaiensis TaxID=2292706 RepID=A0A371JKR5_9FLAO|nr:hypothetical protein [Allomuricauda nanhaiensis]RDY57544.1 hypothetical protein DX873_18725 [Allomuricauda nanhaiensis]